MKYCMGLEANWRRCMTCKRLPRSPEDEERGGVGWLDQLKMQTPCAAYKTTK